MSRIRTIKPEFCTSEQTAECSPVARLLFILMWTHCDDYGNHPAKHVQLKMECFPADSFTREDMSGFVQELLDANLIYEYVGDDGQKYWHVTSWAKHQRIDRPTQRWPREPEIRRALDEPSTNTQRALDECSTSPRRALDEESTSPRPGMEWNGKESKGEDTSRTAEPTEPPKVGLAPDKPEPKPRVKKESSGLLFLLKDGSAWALPREQLEDFEETYGERVDVRAALRRAQTWLKTNPERRPISRMGRFLNSWLLNDEKRSQPQKQTSGVNWDEVFGEGWEDEES